MEKDIEKYEALYYQLWQKNDREALLKKMQEAVRQYPAEFRLLVRYLNVMAWYAGVSSDNALAVKNEVISVYERIQSHCTTDSIRIWAKKLCAIIASNSVIYPEVEWRWMMLRKYRVRCL